LAKHTSKYKELKVKKHEYKEPNVATQDVPTVDWGYESINYFEELSAKATTMLKRKALKYTLLDGDLYRRTIDSL